MNAKPLTGRTVFLITASAFAVIIGVNLTLAFSAVATFPGLETRNSYVASQSFEARRDAQDALGWDVTAAVEEGRLVVSFLSAEGPVAPEIVQATLGRATHVDADRSPDLTWTGTAYTAPVELQPGNWNLRLVALADDGTRFERRFPIQVRPGL
ncbi:MAG: FixH family protein [Paracoccaceae bacterium]|nr:FixH family protein [Paracoccaceae bacterium]